MGITDARFPRNSAKFFVKPKGQLHNYYLGYPAALIGYRIDIFHCLLCCLAKSSLSKRFLAVKGQNLLFGHLMRDHFKLFNVVRRWILKEKRDIFFWD